MLFSVRGSERDFSKITGLVVIQTIEVLSKAIMSRIKCSLKFSFLIISLKV